MARGLAGTKRLLERAGTKAAITSATIATSGRLNPEQADRFIDYVMEETVVFKDGIRVLRMKADRRDLDKITVGTRVLRAAVEATAPTDVVGVTTAKRSLVVTEMILPVDISFTTMEDNIEQENFDDHVLQLFAKQLANDLEDLALNGDEDDPGDFLSIEDGWLKILEADAIVYDMGGSADFRNGVFEHMLQQLPTKFRGNPSALRFYTSVNNAQKYRFQLGQRQTTGGDTILQEGGAPPYSGVRVVGVPFMPDRKVVLTMPDNLAVGIHRDIQMGLFKHERKRVWEYTWTMRVDFEIVEETAAVIGLDA